jgi:class 3 adenylate cyclase
MPRLQARLFDAPDELRTFPLARIEMVKLDELQVGRCRFEPGWRWSAAFGELLGTTSCPIRHLGYAIAGSMRVLTDDGQTIDIGPNSVFDIPAGHDKWVIGDQPWLTVEWGGSHQAMGEVLHEDTNRTLATVLFIDIVDSTGRLARIGDAPWRDELSAHRAAMRKELNVFRGREVQTTGDGLLAIFDSPARAVRCAVAMVVATRSTELAIRVGVHTGEVELVGEDVRGIAVHVAARVLATAAAGEVLVTATTADLLEGAGFELDEAGTHELRGLPGERRLYRVRERS